MVLRQIPLILQGAEVGLAMAPEPGQQILPKPRFTEQEDSAARHREQRAQAACLHCLRGQLRRKSH